MNLENGNVSLGEGEEGKGVLNPPSPFSKQALSEIYILSIKISFERKVPNLSGTVFKIIFNIKHKEYNLEKIYDSLHHLRFRIKIIIHVYAIEG